jgi:hypothetical protein
MGLTRRFASIEQEKSDKNQEKSAKKGKRVNADTLHSLTHCIFWIDALW